MSNNAAVLTAALLLLTTGFLQIKDGRAQPGWIVFSPEGGGFSVALPGQPTRRPLPHNTKAEPSPAPLYELTSGDFAYVVSYIDYPFSAEGAERDELLDKGAEAGITGAGGKVVSSKPISLGGHPGREVEGEVKGVAYRSRVYLVDRRLYLLIVWQRPGSAGSENAAKFFESFKLAAR